MHRFAVEQPTEATYQETRNDPDILERRDAVSMVTE
jgi:hypothetical protein